MNRYVSMLRGINVSGQKKVPMAELRAQLSDIGLENLQTYIQSGNLTFRSAMSKDQITDAIIGKIREHFDFEVPVLVIGAAEFAEIIIRNPFKHQDQSKLYVTFMGSAPGPEVLDALPPSPNPNEDYQVLDDVIYVYCPDGYGRTKINNNFFEKKLKITATTRNWKTCLKLLELVNSIQH